MSTSRASAFNPYQSSTGFEQSMQATIDTQHRLLEHYSNNTHHFSHSPQIRQIQQELEMTITPPDRELSLSPPPERQTSTSGSGPFRLSTTGSAATERETAIQKVLLIANVATAILAAIPPISFAGALANRSVSLISSIYNIATNRENPHWTKVALQVAAIAMVVLGLVAVAIHSVPLMVASLGVSIATSVASSIRELIHGNIAGSCLEIMAAVISALAIAAIVQASWPIMVAAGAVSIVYMIGKTIHMVYQLECNTPTGLRGLDSIDLICHVALVILSTAVLGTAVRTSYIRTNSTSYSYQNKTDHAQVIYEQYSERQLVRNGYYRTEWVYAPGKNNTWSYQPRSVYVSPEYTWVTKDRVLEVLDPNASFTQTYSGSKTGLLIGDRYINNRPTLSRELNPSFIDRTTVVEQPLKPEGYLRAPLPTTIVLARNPRLVRA